MGDDADVLALGFENRPLFDMQFEESLHPAGADFFVALPADAFQLVAEFFALRIGVLVDIVLLQHAGEDARCHHRWCKARTFLVRPVGDDDGMLRVDVEVVESADDFEPRKHAQHAVIAPAGRLRVEVRSDIDGQGIGVGAGPRHEHGAHLVDAHAAAGFLAPFLEQPAPFAILVGDCLAVRSAGNPGADLGHFVDRIPEPVAVDLQVLAWRCHRLSPTSIPFPRMSSPYRRH